MVAGVESQGDGNGGSITLNSEQVEIRNGGTVTVSNQGIGNAGTLQIFSNFLTLDDSGKFLAKAVAGQGGDIQLQISDFFLLRRNSLISATSGQIGSDGVEFTSCQMDR